MQLVGHHCTGDGIDRPGGVVIGCQIHADRLGAVPCRRRSLFIHHAADAADGEDVIQGIMAAGTNGEIIVALVQDVAALLCFVRPVDRIFIVACQEIVGNGNSHNFAFPGGQLPRLLESNQLHRRLLHHSGFIGSLGIKLHQALGGTGEAAVVGNLHAGGNGMLLLVPLNVLNFLGKISITQSITEGICHLVCIRPGVAHKRTGTAGGVVNAQHLVLIAGFVILVANVDVLGIHQIPVCIELIQVRKLVVAKILHCCAGQRGCCPGVCQMTGDIGFPGENVCQPDEAIVARSAKHQAGIHAVFGIFNPLNVHGKGAVDQDDNLIEFPAVLYHAQ